MRKRDLVLQHPNGSNTNVILPNGKIGSIRAVSRQVRMLFVENTYREKLPQDGSEGIDINGYRQVRPHDLSILAVK